MSEIVSVNILEVACNRNANWLKQYRALTGLLFSIGDKAGSISCLRTERQPLLQTISSVSLEKSMSSAHPSAWNCRGSDLYY